MKNVYSLEIFGTSEGKNKPSLLGQKIFTGSFKDMISYASNMMHMLSNLPFQVVAKNMNTSQNYIINPNGGYKLKMGGKLYRHGGNTENSENKEMLLNQAEEFEHHAEEFEDAVKKSDHIPAWVVAKSERASTDLSDITHYLDSENEQREEMVEGEEMASGGNVKYYDEKKHDFSSGYPSFKKYNGAIGEISWYILKRINYGILYPLDEFDKEYYSQIKLNEDERLFRYRTDSMKEEAKYLIKINIEKGLLYFISYDNDYSDDKNVKFDKKGIEARYIYLESGKLDYYSKKDEINLEESQFGKLAEIPYKGKLYIAEWNSERATKSETTIYESNYTIVDKKSSLYTEVHQKLLKWMKDNKMEEGGEMAKGGIVVTKIDDIPNLEEKIVQGKVTYRGLGLGKLSNEFYKVANTSGYRIKVDGKEYFITDDDFDKISRDKNGKMRIRFDAPFRKFEEGGDMAKGGEVERLNEYLKKLVKSLPNSPSKSNRNKILLEISKVKEQIEVAKKNKIADGGEMAKGGKIYKIQVKDSDDLQPKWQDDTFYTGGKKYLSYGEAQKAVKKLQGDTAYYSKQFKVVEDKEKMASGGKVTFDDKVAAIKKSLLKRKKVPKSVQKDYGKTYSPKEAEQSAKRIVGAMVRDEKKSKLSDKMKGIFTSKKKKNK